MNQIRTRVFYKEQMYRPNALSTSEQTIISYHYISTRRAE